MTSQQIEEKIQRTVKFISTLSPWNLERGEETLKELIAEERVKAQIDELKNTVHTAHLYSDSSSFTLLVRVWIPERIKQLKALAFKEASL